MKSYKRGLAWLLIAAMLLSCFSCSKETKNPVSSTIGGSDEFTAVDSVFPHTGVPNSLEPDSMNSETTPPETLVEENMNRKTLESIMELLTDTPENYENLSDEEMYEMITDLLEESDQTARRCYMVRSLPGKRHGYPYRCRGTAFSF